MSEDRIEQARRLTAYLHHLDGCPATSRADPERRCTCGLRYALAHLSERLGVSLSDLLPDEPG